MLFADPRPGKLEGRPIGSEVEEPINSVKCLGRAEKKRQSLIVDEAVDAKGKVRRCDLGGLSCELLVEALELDEDRPGAKLATCPDKGTVQLERRAIGSLSAVFQDQHIPILRLLFGEYAPHPQLVLTSVNGDQLGPDAKRAFDVRHHLLGYLLALSQCGDTQATTGHSARLVPKLGRAVRIVPIGR